MKVQLLGHEAEVSYISPRRAFSPRRSTDTIAVWFEFKEAVSSVLSFAIDIKAKDYDPQEFFEVIMVRGEEALRNIMWEDAEERAKRAKEDENREALKKVTAALGAKLGIEFHLDLRGGERVGY